MEECEELFAAPDFAPRSIDWHLASGSLAPWPLVFPVRGIIHVAACRATAQQRAARDEACEGERSSARDNIMTRNGFLDFSIS